MLRHPQTFVAVGLCLLNSAYAQNSPAIASVTNNSKLFSFNTSSTSAQTNQQTFCLPRGEQLIKVTGAHSVNSNATSNVNVVGDVATNCINLTVNLPAAKPLCLPIPAPNLFQPNQSKELCKTVPIVLDFVVEYQSRPAETSPPSEGTNR